MINSKLKRYHVILLNLAMHYTVYLTSIYFNKKAMHGWIVNFIKYQLSIPTLCITAIACIADYQMTGSGLPVLCGGERANQPLEQQKRPEVPSAFLTWISDILKEGRGDIFVEDESFL